MTANCEVRDPKPRTAKKPGVRLRSRLQTWLNYDMKPLIKIISRIWLYNSGYTCNIENEIHFVKNGR